MAISELNKYIPEGNIPDGYWIAGDDAYKCTEKVITPFKKAFSAPYTDSFSFYQSSHRIHAEQTFGQLTHKWRVLRRPLQQDLDSLSLRL